MKLLDTNNQTLGETTMSDDSTKPLSKVIRIDESEIRGHLDELVRGTVEETGSVKNLSHILREAVPRSRSSCCRDSLFVLHLEQPHVHILA